MAPAAQFPISEEQVPPIELIPTTSGTVVAPPAAAENTASTSTFAAPTLFGPTVLALRLTRVDVIGATRMASLSFLSTLDWRQVQTSRGWLRL